MSLYTGNMSALVTLAPAGALDASGLEQKEARLFEVLRELGSVIIAYSGGADSAYLAWVAHRALGDRALAVTADSASLPASHKRDAEAFALEHSLRHEFISTLEFDNPDYVKNAPGPVLSLQGRVVRAAGPISSRSWRGARDLWCQRGRPGRLSSGSVGGEAASGEGSFGGSRPA